jgi:hypothetical protein
MAKAATATVQYGIVGDSMSGGVTSTMTNANAPPPQAVQLLDGNNTIAPPSGYTVTSVTLVPPSGSSNAKALKGASGDTGFGSWTTQWVTLPISDVGSVIVTSAGTEVIMVEWC